jgi:hypothetical protein
MILIALGRLLLHHVDTKLQFMAITVVAATNNKIALQELENLTIVLSVHNNNIAAWYHYVLYIVK